MPKSREISTADESVTLPVTTELDLRATLQPLHGWFARDGWWLPARTPHGPASLRLSRTREGLHADAWGEGAGWLVERAGRIAGLDDDPASFTTDHPVVGELHRRNPGLRFGRTDLVFPALLVAICGQKVTGREAAAASRGLRRLFSDPAPGPKDGLLLPPSPQRMAEAPYWMFHQAHLEKRRADLVIAVARQAEQIEALAGLPSGGAAGFLQGITGIGPWSVAKTLAVSHGDADQVAVGDFHYKHIVVHHLTGKDRGTDEEMVELLEPFRPHRGRVIRLLHLLGHEPKFGPRLTPRDITRM